MFTAVSQHLKAAGLKLSMGTIVDASITSASSWLRRQDLSCDRERHKFREVGGDAWP
jgi:hypothetical protein